MLSASPIFPPVNVSECAILSPVFPLLGDVLGDKFLLPKLTACASPDISSRLKQRLSNNPAHMTRHDRQVQASGEWHVPRWPCVSLAVSNSKQTCHRVVHPTVVVRWGGGGVHYSFWGSGLCLAKATNASAIIIATAPQDKGAATGRAPSGNTSR